MKKTSIPLGGLNHNNFDGCSRVLNLRLKDGGFRPISVPDAIDTNATANYIHSSTTYRNLIGYSTNAGRTTITFIGQIGDENATPIDIGSFYGNISELTHIGNTLIALTDNGPHYFLFKDNEYSYLGSKIPSPKISFKVTDADVSTVAKDMKTKAEQNLYNSTYFLNTEKAAIEGNVWSALTGVEEDIQDLRSTITDDFNAAYNKAISELNELGCIPTFPLQARCAIRLYDQTYINHSAPILLSTGTGIDSLLYCRNYFDKALSDVSDEFWYPIGDPFIVEFNENGEKYEIEYPLAPHVFTLLSPSMLKYYQDAETGNIQVQENPLRKSLKSLIGEDNLTAEFRRLYTKKSRFAIKARSLYFTIEFDEKELERWKDIIYSIDIFVSKQVTPYKIGELVDFPNDEHISIWKGYPNKHDFHVANARRYYYNTPYKGMKTYSTEEMKKEVSSNGNFYLLKSIGVNDEEYKESKYRGQWVSLADDIKEKFFSIEQERSLTDDYASRNTICGNTAYVYNQSLHLGDITTTLFKGFNPKDYFIHGINGQETPTKLIQPDTTDVGYSHSFYDDAEKNECVSVNTSTLGLDNPISGFTSGMIYVPDADCKTIELGIVCADGECRKVVLPLTVHPSLNGAYYNTDDLSPLRPFDSATMLTMDDEKTGSRHEPNKLVSTSISNPFIFQPERTNIIGNTRIMAMKAPTTPLSTGQFGQFSLYVFCEDGIFALDTTNEGNYATAKPVSFDILLDKNMIASTENAVIFASKQGIKILSGTSTAVLSTPLNGTTPRYAEGEDFQNQILHEFITDDLNCPDLLDYLKGDKVYISYDYPHAEVWVANLEYKYAYIYNLDSKTWTMRSYTLPIVNILSAYPYMYLNTGYSLLDVCSDGKEKMPFVVVTNPIGSQTFVHYHDITMNMTLKTKDLRILTFVGSNPFRPILCKDYRIKRDTPVQIPGIHIDRIPSSVRYIQFAFSGTADEALLTGFTAMISDEPYNSVR